MSAYPVLRIKRGKEGSAFYHHPWVFSGALEEIPVDLATGSFVHVANADGRILGTGTYSFHSMIAVRLFAFGEVVVDADWIRRAILTAAERRRFAGFETTLESGFRVCFGEVDALPGLVIDRYADVFVVQIATAGMERLRDFVTGTIVEELAPRSIIERSDLSVRREEGLDERSGILYGADADRVVFSQGDFRFIAQVKTGQKTGFYLDQRDLRRETMRLAKGCSVLNLFANTGSFAVAALKGGAKSVHNVDSSESALALCKEQLRVNDLNPDQMSNAETDIFDWISEQRPPTYDMIILDPPALIKSHHDAEAGRRAYHFLNRAAMGLTHDKGILITSSCSAFLPEEDFAHLLRRASVQAGVHLDLLAVVRQSADHPISLYFPESAYLKTFVCRVRR